MDKIEYTVVVNGKPEGPYRLEELKNLNIEPETFIRRPGMDDYKEAHEFPELRELFGFVHQAVVPQYFASFDQRLLAAVIDYFLILCAYVILVLLLFIVIEAQTQRMMLALFGLPIIPLTKFIYGSIAESTTKQGTIGKVLLRIKVTDTAGNRISLMHSFGRNAAKIFSSLTLFIGYLYSFLNKKRQCLHDVMAGTLVVNERLI